MRCSLHSSAIWCFVVKKYNTFAACPWKLTAPQKSSKLNTNFVSFLLQFPKTLFSSQFVIDPQCTPIHFVCLSFTTITNPMHTPNPKCNPHWHLLEYTQLPNHKHKYSNTKTKIKPKKSKKAKPIEKNQHNQPNQAKHWIILFIYVSFKFFCFCFIENFSFKFHIWATPLHPTFINPFKYPPWNNHESSPTSFSPVWRNISNSHDPFFKVFRVYHIIGYILCE